MYKNALLLLLNLTIIQYPAQSNINLNSVIQNKICSFNLKSRKLKFMKKVFIAVSYYSNVQEDNFSYLLLSNSCNSFKTLGYEIYKFIGKDAIKDKILDAMNECNKYKNSTIVVCFIGEGSKLTARNDQTETDNLDEYFNLSGGKNICDEEIKVFRNSIHKSNSLYLFFNSCYAKGQYGYANDDTTIALADLIKLHESKHMESRDSAFEHILKHSILTKKSKFKFNYSDSNSLYLTFLNGPCFKNHFDNYSSEHPLTVFYYNSDEDSTSGDVPILILLYNLPAEIKLKKTKSFLELEQVINQLNPSLRYLPINIPETIKKQIKSI